MRGVVVSYEKLGKLLKEGRERKGMTLDEAAMIIGVTNGQYLWRCENDWSNFPAGSLRRALDLYDIKQADAVDLICEDFRSALVSFLRKK